MFTSASDWNLSCVIWIHSIPYLFTINFNIITPYILPVHHRSAISIRWRHCLLSSVYSQLRGERRRLNDLGLIPTNQWLPSTAYDFTSRYVNMDRHRHPCNERVVPTSPTFVSSVNILRIKLCINFTSPSFPSFMFHQSHRPTPWFDHLDTAWPE
jgi:hypothetical protein